MTAFLQFFSFMWQRIIFLFDSVKFDMFGYDVSLFGILFVLIIIGLLVSVFWKGAKT